MLACVNPNFGGSFLNTLNSPNEYIQSKSGGAISAVDSGILHHSPNKNESIPFNSTVFSASPVSFSLGHSNSSSGLSTSDHTPKAAKVPNLNTGRPQHVMISKRGTLNHAGSENMFNNTDPHTVHTEQSNAMPNHGRNVHEDAVSPIASYYPYFSTVAIESRKSPQKQLSTASLHHYSQHNVEFDHFAPSHSMHHRSISSVLHCEEIAGYNRDVNSCAFSSASESACYINSQNHANEEKHSDHHHHYHNLHYRHDPYATRHILRASCLPFERIAFAKSDLQAVINAVCGENFNAVVESVQKAAIGHCLEATIRTSQPRIFADKMAEAVVLMDRKGFYVAHYIERKIGENNILGNMLSSVNHPSHPVVFSTRQALLDYCEHIRNLPQQERHWRLDGLPCSTAGFRVDGFEVKHGNNRGDKNYRQAHLARNQRRPYAAKGDKKLESHRS